MGIHPQVRVAVRPYGSSIPLGFFAFGVGMFLYAALDAPWVKATDAHSLGLLLAGRGGSREAMEGGLAEQLKGLEDVAGVRHTL